MKKATKRKPQQRFGKLRTMQFYPDDEERIAAIRLFLGSPGSVAKQLDSDIGAIRYALDETYKRIKKG